MENVKGNTKSLIVSDDVFSGIWGERSMDRKKFVDANFKCGISLSGELLS